MVATEDGDNWDLVVELIAQKNVDLNIRGRLGYTVLMWATLKGNFDMVSQLLQHDTLDTNLKNIAGSTALDIAHNCGHKAIASLLQDTDASPTKKMKMTPMIP
jgi:ankyrin repeat protein